MNRRPFIRNLILGALVVSAGGLYWGARNNNRNSLIRPAVLGRICDRETLIDIGLQYMDKSGETDALRLEEMIIAELPPIRLNQEAQLQKKIAAEYRSGETVVLNGWMMSVTEARQCALLAHDASKRMNNAY